MSSIPVANFASCLGKYDTTIQGSVVSDSADYAGTGDISFNGGYILNTTTFVLPAPVTGNGISFSGWFYPTGVEPTNTALFDVSCTPAATTSHIAVYFTGTNALSMTYNGTSAATSSNVYNTNAWNFFMYTVCCSGNVAIQNLYVNTIGTGANPATLTNMAGTYTQYTVNSTFLGFGVGSTFGVTKYVGKMDDFRFYSRVITPMEYRVLQGSNYGNKAITNPVPSLGTMTVGSSAVQGSTAAQSFNISTSGTFANLQVSRTTVGGSTTTLNVSASQLTINPVTQNYTWTDTGLAGSTNYSYSFFPIIAGTNGTSTTFGIQTVQTYNINLTSISYAGVSYTSYSQATNGILTGQSVTNNFTYTNYAFLNYQAPYIINYTCVIPSIIYVLAVGGGGVGSCTNSGQVGGGGGGGGVVMLSVVLPSGSGTIQIQDGSGGYFNGVATNTTVVFSATPSSNITAYGGGAGVYGAALSKNFLAQSRTGASNGCGVNDNTLYPTGVCPYNFGNPSSGGMGCAGGAGDTYGTGIRCFLPGIRDFSPLGTSLGTYYWGGGGRRVLAVAGYANFVSYLQTFPPLGGGGQGGTNSQHNTSVMSSAAFNAPSISLPNSNNGYNGIPNSGGGGGGGIGGGGSGGSGIVVIAFPQNAITSNAQAVLTPTQLADVSYQDVMSKLSTSGYNSMNTAYSTRLVNYNYFGPIMCLSSRGDYNYIYQQNFYSDVFGNLTTEYGGGGISLAKWLQIYGSLTNIYNTPTSAFVSIWYDQAMNPYMKHIYPSSMNFSGGTTPFYDISNQSINFGYAVNGDSFVPDNWSSAGARGYTCAINNNALPSSFPIGDTSFSYVMRFRKPYTNSSAQYFFQTQSNSFSLGFNASNNYCSQWNGTVDMTFAATPAANDIFSYTYTSGRVERTAYLNGVQMYSTVPASIRTQAAEITYFGNNAQFYFFYSSNISLSSADRIVLEGTPTNINTNFINTNALITYPRNTLSNTTYVAPPAGSPIMISSINYVLPTAVKGMSYGSNASSNVLSGTSVFNGVTYNVFSFMDTNNIYRINYTCTNSTNIYVLAVGGGGPGWGYNNGGGGGGAGGVVMVPVRIPSGTGTITVSVGLGGRCYNTYFGFGNCQTNGFNSTVYFSADPSSNIIAGGGATSSYISSGTPFRPPTLGSCGASNSGQPYQLNSYISNNLANTGSSVNNSAPDGFMCYGGGGGAGGSTGNSDGADGVLCNLPGINTFTPAGYKPFGTYYWGGGGGSGSVGLTPKAGRGGGGGGSHGYATGCGESDRTGINSTVNGSTNSQNAILAAGNGAPNTGGGGGGAFNSYGGGDGGSGIVVISFPQVAQTPTPQGISADAYSSMCAAYGTRLLNPNYYGPILTLRWSTDTFSAANLGQQNAFCQQFFSDASGNLSTGYGGTGTTLANWLAYGCQMYTADTRFAYVVKLWDQSTSLNSASQIWSAASSQPVYDVSWQVINFGYSGANGGFVGTVNSNAYLTIPNTFSGLSAGNQSFTNVFRVSNTTTGGTQGIFQLGPSQTTGQEIMATLSTGGAWQYSFYSTNYGTLTYSSQNVVSVTYASGSMNIYVNGTNSNFSPGTLNFNPTGTNTLGSNVGVSTTNYFNGQLCNFYIFSTALSNADRLLIEATPYIAGNGLTNQPLMSSLTNLSSSLNLYVQRITCSATAYTQGVVSNTLVDNNITYTCYAFLSTGTTYTVSYMCGSSTIIYVLAVGGGGGGGGTNGGGGGGGGVVMLPVILPSTSGSLATISISVGAGGAAGSGTAVGSNGSNTTVTFSATVTFPNAVTGTAITAYGGNGGDGSAGQNTNTNGGSAGGSSYSYNVQNTPYSNGSGYNFGNFGGGTIGSTSCGSGGGGGAGTPGTAGKSITIIVSGAATVCYTGGHGGDGIQCSLPGIRSFSPYGTAFGTYYWGGGGGGAIPTPPNINVSISGNGGKGGGAPLVNPNNASYNSLTNNGIAMTYRYHSLFGAGITYPQNTTPKNTNGAMNTGGGGGGNNGIGGSGIVVISFPQTVLTSNMTAVLTAAQLSSNNYNDAVGALSASATSKISTLYSTKLLNYNYFGPVMNLRLSSDVSGIYTQNFYADVCGNLGTGYLGTGVPLWYWLVKNGSTNYCGVRTPYAYVTKWYNQSMNSTFNHAYQYNLNSQPIYDLSNGILNFGYTGTGGGAISPNTNCWLTMPNGTLPFNDSAYSYILRTWNVGSNPGGIVNGGVNNGSSTCMIIRVQSATTYVVAWGTYNYVVTPSVGFTAGTFHTLSSLYNGGGVAPYSYADGGSVVTGGAATTKSQSNTNNYIGTTNSNTTNVPGTEYFNGQLYNLFSFSGNLSNADIAVMENNCSAYPTMPVNTLPIIGYNLLSPTSFNISWNTPTGYLSYSYTINGVSVLPSVAPDTSGIVTATFTNVPANVINPEWIFILTASTAGGPLVATVGMSYLPGTFGDISATAVSCGYIKLTWAGATGIGSNINTMPNYNINSYSLVPVYDGSFNQININTSQPYNTILLPISISSGVGAPTTISISLCNGSLLSYTSRRVTYTPKWTSIGASNWLSAPFSNGHVDTRTTYQPQSSLYISPDGKTLIYRTMNTSYQLAQINMTTCAVQQYILNNSTYQEVPYIWRIICTNTNIYLLGNFNNFAGNASLQYFIKSSLSSISWSQPITTIYGAGGFFNGAYDGSNRIYITSAPTNNTQPAPTGTTWTPGTNPGTGIWNDTTNSVVNGTNFTATRDTNGYYYSSGGNGTCEGACSFDPCYNNLYYCVSVSGDGISWPATNPVYTNAIAVYNVAGNTKSIFTQILGKTTPPFNLGSWNAMVASYTYLYCSISTVSQYSTVTMAATNGTICSNIMAISTVIGPTYGQIFSMGGGLNGSVTCVAYDSNRKLLFVGGSFTMAGNTPATYCAIWIETTQTWVSLAAVDQMVYDMVWSGYYNTLYISGNFTVVNGTAANGFCALQINDSVTNYNGLFTVNPN